MATERGFRGGFGADLGLLMDEYGMGGKGLHYDLTAKFPCFIFDPMAPLEKRGTAVVQSQLYVTDLKLLACLLDSS